MPVYRDDRDALRLRVERGGRLDGVVLYFVAHLDDEVRISSAPSLTRTHWPQIVYLRAGERHVSPGDAVDVSIAYLGGTGLCVAIR